MFFEKVSIVDLSEQEKFFGVPMRAVSEQEKAQLEENNRRLAIEQELFSALTAERIRQNRAVRRINRQSHTRFLF